MYASKRLQGFVNVPRTWPQTQVKYGSVHVSAYLALSNRLILCVTFLLRYHLY